MNYSGGFWLYRQQAEVVEETIKEHEKDKPNLRLIKEKERRGKASAINFGKETCKRRYYVT